MLRALLRATLAATALLASSSVVLAPVARAAGPGPFVAVAGVDPGARTVGVAGSSCGLRDASAMAVVAPGRGAAALEPPDPGSADAALGSLRAGGEPAAITDVAAGRGARSAAVATMSGTGAARIGAPVGGGDTRTGPRTALIAAGAGGDLDAAAAAAEGAGSLGERLIGSLEAAWKPSSCAGRPTDAFVIVAGPTSAPLAPADGLRAARARVRDVLATSGGSVAADELADRLLEAAALPRPRGPGAPDVYLSLLQPPGGFDAVALLRQAYDQTQGETDRPSPSVAASAGRTLDPESRSSGPGTGAAIAVVAVLVVGLIAAVAGIARRLRAMKEE